MNEFSKTPDWRIENTHVSSTHVGSGIHSLPGLLGASHLLLTTSHTPSGRRPCLPFSLSRGTCLINRSVFLTFALLAPGDKVQIPDEKLDSPKSKAELKEDSYIKVSPRVFHRTPVFVLKDRVLHTNTLETPALGDTRFLFIGKGSVSQTDWILAQAARWN